MVLAIRINVTWKQARREGGVWVSYPGPRGVWGPAVAQKYKVHQNATF